MINGRVTMIKATGEGLVAEIALERDGYTYYQQAIQVNCPREPRELDVGDDIAVTIRKRVEERDGVPSEEGENTVVAPSDKKILQRLKDVLAGLYDEHRIGFDQCFLETIDRVIDNLTERGSEVARKSKLKNVLTYLEEQDQSALTSMKSSAEENNFEIAQIHKQYHEAFAQGIAVCGGPARLSGTDMAGKGVK